MNRVPSQCKGTYGVLYKGDLVWYGNQKLTPKEETFDEAISALEITSTVWILALDNNLYPIFKEN